jgi:spore coat protein U-like protein
MLELQLSDAIKYYITLQETRTNLSLSEVISDLAFTVYQDINNLQKIKFNIQVKVASGQQTTLNLSQEV